MSSPVKQEPEFPAVKLENGTPIPKQGNSSEETHSEGSSQQQKDKSDENEQVVGEGVKYDDDGIPIPSGIEEVKEEDLQDTGETLNLEMEHADNPVWLVKLTPQLTSIWKKKGFLKGQELGQVKIQRGTSPPKIFLDLNQNIPEHRHLDSQYQLHMTKQAVNNEFIFSETEFDHFKHRLLYRTQVVEMPYQPKLRSLNNEALNHAAKWTRKTKTFRREQPESGMGTTRTQSFARRQRSKFKRFIPFAKTIPKKTELVGKVVHECQVIPSRLATNNKLKLAAQKRFLAKMVKKKHINYLKNANTGILQGRAGPNIHTGATITLSRDLAAKREAAKTEGRASRMDKKVLMKLLFQLFDQYDYWTMKGLKEKTNQPEAYLKECLENIAVMERRGPYALKYRLKDEYKKSRDVERKAKEGLTLEEMEDEEKKKAEEESEEEEEEEDDIEMEDVAKV